MPEINPPPGFSNEPLLAGVEDNPVYRMLAIVPKQKKRPPRTTTSQWFPFTEKMWRDLDLTLLGPRDFALGLWAHRFAKARRRLRILIARLLMFALLLLLAGCLAHAKLPIKFISQQTLFFGCIGLAISFLIQIYFQGYAVAMGLSPYAALPSLVWELELGRCIRLGRPRAWKIFFALLLMVVLYTLFGMVSLILVFKSIYRLHIHLMYGLMIMGFFLAGLGMILPIGSIIYGRWRREALFKALVYEVGEALEEHKRDEKG
ncbi:MAG: hypothetical protein ABFD69_06490 [Candidatus Sumerlaeia bacterium]